jgi:membrane protease YdiL (CAAX protease family)
VNETTQESTSQPATSPTTNPIIEPAPNVLFMIGWGILAFIVFRQLGFFRGNVQRWPFRIMEVRHAQLLMLSGASAFFGMYAIVPILLASLGITSSTSPLAATAMLGGSMSIIAVGLVVLLHRFDRSLPARLGINRAKPAHLGLGFGLFLLALPCVSLAHAGLLAILSHFDISHPGAHATLLRMQSMDRATLVLTLINVTLIVPIFEELLFRGCLQTAFTIAARNRLVPILISSVFFAIMHEPWTMPAIFVLALLLGYAYERTGNLWAPIALHVAFNAFNAATFILIRM